MRSPLCAGLLLLAMIASPLASVADDQADDLEQLVEEAIAQNPSVEAMRYRTEELSRLADISNAWPDPRVSVEYLNAPVDTFSIEDSPMSGVQFMLQQRLPEWGWTRAVEKVAGHRVERSRHVRAETEVRLGHSVEMLYWQLTLSRLLERVTEDHVSKADELMRAVRVRYEVGRAGQNALLRLEVLRDRLRDDLGDFASADQRLSAGLARTLARSANSPFSTPRSVEAIAPEGDSQLWIDAARSDRPELAAIEEEIREQGKAAELSRVRIRPEVDVWVKYRLRTVDTPTDDGTDFFSAGVSVPIPWGSRIRGKGGEAASLAAGESARARLAATLDGIEAELISVEARWRRAFEKAATYENSLIPQAATALETTLSDFSVGKADFSTLYEAEIDLLDLERAQLSAAVETHLQRAAARAATGRRVLPGGS